MLNISKQRSCPDCDRPVGFFRMFIRAGTSAYWDCPGCGAELQFDFERRKKVAGYSALAMAPAIALAFFDLWWAAIPALGLSL